MIGKALQRRMGMCCKTIGYILAASNNARNGPWEPIFEAAAAVLIP